MDIGKVVMGVSATVIFTTAITMFVMQGDKTDINQSKTAMEIQMIERKIQNGFPVSDFDRQRLADLKADYARYRGQLTEDQARVRSVVDDLEGEYDKILAEQQTESQTQPEALPQKQEQREKLVQVSQVAPKPVPAPLAKPKTKQDKFKAVQDEFDSDPFFNDDF